MMTRIWLCFALAGTAFDAGTTLVGVLSIPSYERNGLVNGFGLIQTFLLTLLLATTATAAVRYVVRRNDRYNALLSTCLGVWGLTRWAAVIVFALGADGMLR